MPLLLLRIMKLIACVPKLPTKLPGCKKKSAYCGYDWALPKSGDRHAQEGG